MVAVVRAVSAMVLLWLPGLAAADLKECAELGAGSGHYKVVIDELALPADSSAAASALADLKQRIAFTLSTQLQEFQSEVASQKVNPTIDMGVVTCANRKPSLTGAEFTAARVETLSDQRVVVELWGNLLAPGENQTAPRAMLGYVIPPVKHYLSGPAVPGLFLIEYPKEGATQFDAVNKLPEASAFALLGLAVKARKALKYDLAVWAFNRSSGSMKIAQESGGTGNLKPLLDYIEVAICQTREAARADPQYRGALTLTARKVCGGTP
jgi:hypothetical protein